MDIASAAGGISPPRKRSNMLKRREMSTFKLKAQPSYVTSAVSSAYDDLIDTMVQNDRMNSDDNGLEGLRNKIKKGLSTHTMLGQIYGWVLVVISVISCLQYVYSTYVRTSDTMQLMRLEAAEIAWTSVLACDIALHFWLADQKLEYSLNYQTIINSLSIVPILLKQDYMTCPSQSKIVGLVDLFAYLGCGLTTFRLLRPMRIHVKLKEATDDVQRYIGGMGLTIVLMIVFNSGAMQFLERDDNALQFHVWMYWSIVTTSTVGYGDISPLSTVGRIACMIMISIGIILVPKMTNDLIRIVESSSVYSRAEYVGKAYTKHVVICGDMSSIPLAEFFEELFHEDHDAANLEAVVLLPNAPNPEMRMLLNDPLFLTTVTYLQGTALSEKDLLRARVEKAVGIFIMTNKFSSTPDKEDSKIILQQYSIKSFLNSRDVASMPFFGLQLIRGENLRHLSTAEGSNGGKFNEASTREVSICLNEIKLGLIAKSVMFPGASTLIMNLLTSFSDDDDEDIMPKDSDPDSRTSRSRSRSSSMNGTGFGRSTSARYTLPTENVFRTDEWVDEYKMGCDWEIYKSDLPPLFNGYRFSDLVVLLYERIGIVLIGLLIRDLDDETVPLQVVLNPVDYLIKLDREEMKIQGIMLAKNQVTADVSQLTAANSALTPLNADKGLFSVSRIRGVVNPGARKNALERMAGEDTGGRNSGVQVFTGVADEPPRRKKIDVATLKGQLQKVKESVLSQQEQLKFIEDVFMKDNYYLRERAARLAEVTVHTAVLEEIPHINDHIIITGKGISNLYDLIKPLKAKELGPLKYIVILYPDIIPQSVWQRIAIFDGILVIRGSPLEENDIRRAGIFRASQIVILADVSSTGRILSSQDSNKGNLDMAGLEALIDSDSIFAYKAVKRLNDKTGIVVEFVRESNLEYLNLSGTNNFDGAPVTAIANNAGGKAVVNATKKVALSKSKDFDFRESPLFASGSIFTSSLLDTLVCQTFYNPLILDVVQRFLSQKQDSKPSINAAKIFSGESTMSDRNIASVFDIRGSSLYQIDVPDGYVGRSYFSLVKHLAKENMLPIALYRGVVPQLTLGRLMNHLPYVYTNPKKDAEIFFGDKVFVLAPKGRYSSTLKDVVAEAVIHEEMNQFKMKGHLKSDITASHRWILLLQRFELLVSTSSPLPKRSVGSILSSVREFRQNIISLQQDHTSQSGINTAIPTGTGVDKGRAGKLMIQLDPNTRKTKYVVELFMPGIKNLRRIFHQRDMKGIRDAILALILKAAEAEYNKLLCFFTILKGLVDVINDNICSEIRIIENSENAMEENTPSRSPSMYANMRRMVSGSAAFSSTISGKSPAPSPAKMAMSAAASLVPMRSPSIKKAQENSISASMSASANSIPTASKNKLKVQYDKLLERAMQIVSDIIDNVEISIWDAAIEKVAAAHAIAMSTD